MPGRVDQVREEDGREDSVGRGDRRCSGDELLDDPGNFIDVECKCHRRVAADLPIDRVGNQVDELMDSVNWKRRQIGRSIDWVTGRAV